MISAQRIPYLHVAPCPRVHVQDLQVIVARAADRLLQMCTPYHVDARGIRRKGIAGNRGCTLRPTRAMQAACAAPSPQALLSSPCRQTGTPCCPPLLGLRLSVAAAYTCARGMGTKQSGHTVGLQGRHLAEGRQQNPPLEFTVTLTQVPVQETLASTCTCHRLQRRFAGGNIRPKCSPSHM